MNIEIMIVITSALTLLFSGIAIGISYSNFNIANRLYEEMKGELDYDEI